MWKSSTARFCCSTNGCSQTDVITSESGTKRTAICGRLHEIKIVTCAPAASSGAPSYPRAFAMLTGRVPLRSVPQANTMIKDAPRATPIQPTKTRIKRQSTIRCGRSRDHSISSISRTYATGFVSVLALISRAPKYGDMTILYLGRGRIVQQKIGTYRQTPRPLW